VARATIDVDPALVRWAREAAGLTPQSAAKKLGVHPTKLAEWETPGAMERPTPRQLEKLADVVKRPVATFFLPAPPAEPPLPADFRRAPAAVTGPEPLSPAARLAIRRARRLQQVFVELGEVPARMTLRTGLTRTTPAEVAAREARALLGATVAEQAQWNEPRIALNEWRQRFERSGHLVFQFSMPPDEISGFSLATTVPVVVLNKKDTPSRRCFTLFHEWAHLLLGEPGLCFVEEGRATGTGDAVEVFCNAFAGALLVPMDDLKALPALHASRFALDQVVDEGVRQFAVSRLVILRRLHTGGFIDQRTYQQTAARYDQQFRALPPKKKSKGGPAPSRKTVSELGRGFVRHVLRAHDRGQISDVDVADYLSLRLRHLERVEALVSGA
jgi:Zn-dependent peptidase ImmA (M78 family)/transcriptional regulator with XRE-family HTH domain